MTDTAMIATRIRANTFVDQVRASMHFDDAEYLALCDDLEELAGCLRGTTSLDRDLARDLYSIPLIVRNMYLFVQGNGAYASHPLVGKLEDAWVSLDGLVMDCLSA